MQHNKLIEFFAARKLAGQPLVMATVFDTRGSTYSKPGARMLIDENGVFQGMLSGGCLEGDLAIRARQVIESGKPQIASYDLGSDDDELWGLGVGCDGMMRVFLQPLVNASNYEPFESLSTLQQGRKRVVVATVIASGLDGVAAGASVLHGSGTDLSFGVPDELTPELQQRSRNALQGGGAVTEKFEHAGMDLEVFLSIVAPLPRLLVLGGGLDAEPLVRFAAELGWRCTVVDHRPAYIDNNDFSQAEQTLCCSADEVRTSLDLESFDLAVVMSHHLDSDRTYLRQLASSGIYYIGLLGPAGRRQRLMNELGDAAEKLRDRVHGPAGLDLGGRGPAPIALSIVAEMLQQLAKNEASRPGGPAENIE